MQQKKDRAAEDYWIGFSDCVTRPAAKSLVILRNAFENVEGCVGKRGNVWLVRLKIESVIKMNITDVGTEIRDIKTLHAIAKKWKRIQNKG